MSAPRANLSSSGSPSSAPPSSTPPSSAPPHPLTLGERLASIAFWSFVTVSSIALYPIAVALWLVTRPFDPRLRALHLFTCAWASLYTWFNPAWPVTVSGREHIARGVPYVMVANHQSFLDILVLFRLFRHFKWVSKLENFRVPCIGWNMSLNGYIPLRRGDTKSIAAMMNAGARTLAAGSSVLMFPEGTRSVDGKLRTFKRGGFSLALRCGVPILPIVVEGTGNALPKGFVLQRGRHPVRILVLEPLPPESFAGATPEELALRVRGIFLRELQQ